MEKIKLTISVIITLLLASGGTYYLSADDGEEAFYCQSRDFVMICEKLSSGIGTRCYYEDTYKVCSEGWVDYNFEEMEDIEPAPSKVQSKQWLCNQTICVPIK